MSHTVASLKASYQELVAPGSGTRFLRLLNEAESRLQETAKWHWTKTEIPLTITDGCVHIDPTLYASLLGVLFEGTGRVVRPREIEFTPDAGARTVAGAGGTGYLVDSGIVTVDLGSGNVTRRQYKIVDVVDDDATAEGLVLYAHQALSSDSDISRCPSSRALKLAMYACLYEEANDLERSKGYWADAYAALDENEATVRGGNRPVRPAQPWGEGVSPIANLM